MKIYTGAFISSAIPRYFVSLSNFGRKCRFKFPHIHAASIFKRYGTLFNKYCFKVANIKRTILHKVRLRFIVLVPVWLCATLRRVYPFSAGFRLTEQLSRCAAIRNTCACWPLFSCIALRPLLSLRALFSLRSLRSSISLRPSRSSCTLRTLRTCITF